MRGGGGAGVARCYTTRLVSFSERSDLLAVEPIASTATGGVAGTRAQRCGRARTTTRYGVATRTATATAMELDEVRLRLWLWVRLRLQTNATTFRFVAHARAAGDARAERDLTRAKRRPEESCSVVRANVNLLED